MLEKVKDAPGFVKSTETKAVLAVDENALTAYKTRRAASQNLQGALEDINMLKNELGEIKRLLISLLTDRK